MSDTIADLDPVTGLRRGTFGIGTFAHRDRVFPALVRADGGVVDISGKFRDTHEIFDDWAVNFDVLVATEATARAILRIGEVRALPPLAHPNVLCAGANNRTHVAQMLTKNDVYQHNRRPGESDEDFFRRNYEYVEKRTRDGVPFLFLSAHSALAGATDDVLLPPIGEQHDWELELAAVIGRSARFASIDEAPNLIAGYTIVNDIGSIDTARRTDIHFEWDFIGKSQPTFKPFGPFIVPAPFVDLGAMRISLRVNGEVMQDWPADDMIFDFARLVAYATERVRLRPGDVLLGGSPPGNGAHHGGRFLTDGDVIDSEITFLGRQRNRCVTEDIGDRSPAIGLAPSA
jgi:2,4-didehydro-3-deoxy-L-rhamnonate hydrolase